MTPRRDVAFKRTPVAVLGLLIALGCGGGGSGSAIPEQPTAPTLNATGEPTEADWAELATELTAGAVYVLREELTERGVDVAATPWPPVVFAGMVQLQDERTIEVELDGATFGGSFWCCGNIGPEPNAVISYSGRIHAVISDTGRVLRVTETMVDDVPFRWGPRNLTHVIELSPSGLQVVSDLVHQNGRLEPRQVFRLVGTIAYVDLRGERHALEVDTRLGYEHFFREDSGLVSGQIGSTNIPGRRVQARPPTRCSLPREGCGALAEGSAPCTSYPRCR